MPQESRKQAALEFMKLVAAGEVRDAFGRYIQADFRHHNPFFPGDAESLMNAMLDNAKQNPNKVIEIQRALEDGDLVAVHSHVRQNTDDLGGAAVHIFKFQDGRIAEMWDIGQAVLKDSPNEYGMF